MSATLKRYLVLARRTPGFDPAVIAPHHAHLDALRAQGRLELAGPFSDKSGGAYLMRAVDLNEATELAWTDPLHTSGASEITVFEWNAA